MPMRAFLSELGCLPVSAMIHIPKAGEVLNLDGTPSDPATAERWQCVAASTLIVCVCVVTQCVTASLR